MLTMNFYFYLFRQEGAANISVFQRQSRTTSALEAYNGVLGERITKRGHFFKFVRCLQQEEYCKSREFAMLVESGGSTGTRKRKRVCICCMTDIAISI